MNEQTVLCQVSNVYRLLIDAVNHVSRQELYVTLIKIVINLKVWSKTEQMTFAGTDVVGDTKPFSLMSSSNLPVAQLLRNSALLSVSMSPNCEMGCVSKQPRLC